VPPQHAQPQRHMTCPAVSFTSPVQRQLPLFPATNRLHGHDCRHVFLLARKSTLSFLVQPSQPLSRSLVSPDPSSHSHLHPPHLPIRHSAPAETRYRGEPCPPFSPCQDTAPASLGFGIPVPNQPIPSPTKLSHPAHVRAGRVLSLCAELRSIAGGYIDCPLGGLGIIAVPTFPCAESIASQSAGYWACRVILHDEGRWLGEVAEKDEGAIWGYGRLLQGSVSGAACTNGCS
jgi:hypothetical protein